MRVPTLTLSALEATNLEHILREWKGCEYGPDRYKYELWRKVADICNFYDNVEYRKIYNAPLPNQLRK